MANQIIATGAVNAKGFESEAPDNFAFATWRAVPFTPDGPAVFLDGSKVPTYQGQLDASGEFAAGALIGDTSQMRPPNTRFMFQVFPVASVPPITISNVAITGTTPQTLGEILSAQIAPLRIQAGPLVYAYSDDQVINPVAGSGYVNTTTNTQWLFVGSGSVGMWIEVAGGGGGGGVPSGPNHAVQFNASGAFGGDSSLIYQSPNLSLGGDLQTKSCAIISSGSNVPGKLTIRSDANNTAIDPPNGNNGGLYLCEQQNMGVFIGPNLGQIVLLSSGSATFGGSMQVNGIFHGVGAATFDSTVNAAHFLSGTSDTTYLLRLTSATHNQALLETTAAAEFALLRFQTPSQAWTVGASGSAAPGGAIPGGFQIYDATGNGVVVEIDPATGFTHFHGDAVFTTFGGDESLNIGATGHAYIEFSLTAGGQVIGDIHAENNAFLITGSGAEGVVISGQLVTVGDPANPQAQWTYRPPGGAGNLVGSRAFNTVYQNTNGMSLQVSMTYTTAGSATGFVTASIGLLNPPESQVYRNENTASVAGAELAIVLMVPPGWYYQIQPGSAEITGIGRWYEWLCP